MQKRTTIKHAFEPEGDDKLPARYQLIRITEHECRRRDSELWRMDVTVTPTYTREPVATFTRRQLAELIADGADWLAYGGED